MTADKLFSVVSNFANELRELRVQRGSRVNSAGEGQTKRRSLRSAERRQVLQKTNGHCHICGGIIDGRDWEADHVLAHSIGGTHALQNYLPAHSICNNYRWHYAADEFQWILKLGVWLRTQIEKETPIGLLAGKKFCQHEGRRADRRKNPGAASQL